MLRHNNLTVAEENKKLNYHKQIARQLRTQYVEGIYGNSVTLKSRLSVSQGHWNCTIQKLECGFLFAFQWRYLVLFTRYSDLFVEQREIFIPTCIYRPRRGWPYQNFPKTFDAHNTRMIGLPCGEETTTICEAVSIERDERTDRQTDRIAISISRVSVLTRDKNKKICSAMHSRRISLSQAPSTVYDALSLSGHGQTHSVLRDAVKTVPDCGTTRSFQSIFQ